MGLACIANQRIRGGHNDAAAHPEREQQKQNAAKPRYSRQ